MSTDFFEREFASDLERVDGRAKVTGAAKYSAEYHFDRMAYGVLVPAQITKGTIEALDVKAAERAPGVITVLSYLNLPRLPGNEPPADADKLPPTKQGFKIFTDNKVRFNGQPIALVIADTFERATHAASLVKAQYAKEDFITDLHKAVNMRQPLQGNAFREYVRGVKDDWNKAPVTIEAEYEIPIEVHNPMEMHAITVQWNGADKVTVYEKTQSLQDVQRNIARLFGIPSENVRVITQYIGGAFGSAFNFWPHAVAAVIGAKMINRPLKVGLTRPEMFTSVGYRPTSLQKLAMGAANDGRLHGITHEAVANTSSYQEFTEGIVNVTRTLYSAPHITTRYQVYPLDLGLPTWMRGPGEVTGSFAIESAIDELAHKLHIDPLDMRLINYTENDPEHNRPHSTKFLREALLTGAEKIGWRDRNPAPRSMKEGDWLVGYGIGTGVFIAWRGASKLGVTFNNDGTLLLQTAVTDMGPGTATAMTKLASDLMGIPAEKIRFEMGDSSLPPGIFQGGSGTTSSLGTNLSNAMNTLKKRMAELVKDDEVFHTKDIHGVKPEDLDFENGYLILRSDRSRRISYSEVMRRAALPKIEFLEDTKGGSNNQYTSYSYSAHFVKVRVHPATGVVRVSRVVSVIDAGKVVNETTARSQIIGGVVGGIGMALMEEGIIDHRYGRWVNNDLANYHVPVHADVPEIEVHFIDKPDFILNPIGAKGMGEVSMVGFPPAIANAVFHATGKRIRQLPITADKLI